MEQTHQHGPNCKHGHGAHGAHGAHGPQRVVNVDPKQYFQQLKEMKKLFIENYWMQILSGKALSKFLQKHGFNFLHAIDFQVIMMIVAQAQGMFTCEFLPLFLRPFISGLFFPLIFLIFFNFNVIFGVEDEQFTLVHIFGYLTLFFYSLTALKEAGSLSTQRNVKKTEQAINQRPYLQNMKCQPCKILKIFRAFHCPICKICIPKFTRHSLAFNVCIGAGNQILAWGYFICLSITQILTILIFFNNTEYGIITDIIFYALNIYVLYVSLIESVTFYILNFYYGITEYEVRTWTNCQYFIKVPEREFTNCVNKGLFGNLKESIYSLFSISGYESEKKKESNPMQEQIPISQNSGEFEILDKNRTYFINWSKAFFYLTPHIPSYCSRDTVIEMMVKQQPKMIQMFKLQKKFKEQVIKQNEGQPLNPLQLQQKVMAKMQQHMVRYGSPMMRPEMGSRQMQQHVMPSPQQQKAMQIQMLTHMQSQLSLEPEFAQKIRQILQKLKTDIINPMQVGLAVRQIQQDLMKKKMQAVIREKTMNEENAKQSQQITINQQEQEQQLKKQQIPDEQL